MEGREKIMLVSIWYRSEDEKVGATTPQNEGRFTGTGAKIVMRLTAESEPMVMGPWHSLKDGESRDPIELFNYCLDRRDFRWLHPDFSAPFGESCRPGGR